jgi:hypothetical protein
MKEMKNLETGDDLEQVAIHEVAHAIVGAHYGLTIHMVDLYEERTFFKGKSNLEWEKVQELYLAGIAAEYVAGYTHPDSRIQKSGDWITATAAYCNTGIENAEIIERDKEFLKARWEKVQSLAALLLKQGYLDKVDVGECK